MVYGILEFINFAHGEIYMLGATSPSSPWPAHPVGVNTWTIARCW